MTVMQRLGNGPVKEHVSHEAAQAFVESLPDRIRQALEKQATTIDYPIEAILEMANTLWSEASVGHLDDDAISFNDCHPRLD
jgi:hypothetical protein